MTKTLSKYREFVQLKDLKSRTVNSYLANVRLLGEHFSCEPAILTEKQVRDYFLYLRQIKHYKPASMNQAKVAIRTFYHDHLKIGQWMVFDEIKIRRQEELPVILTQEEVRHLLSCVREERFRVFLTFVYSTGLRLSEAARVEVHDFVKDKNKLLVRFGKGGKQRYVPVAETTLTMLRNWWVLHKNPRFLFPAVGRNWRQYIKSLQLPDKDALYYAMGKTDTFMSISTVQNAMRWALHDSGIQKKVSVHTLRHCYATHLLESGVSIRYISKYLGHASLNQTLVYAHLTSASEAQTHAALGDLLKDL